ncbi:efflux RND transporter periplasmic adaptor subunit [Mariniphaga sediminis]|uniref:Efflux RND transporter periplasmic adaptor subunit n=2 Tax=Mariniphaga sediminis TaxID=1628158 RepID=A0A399CY46_9BACT|nr:efflux RND transporter periplasmic adaptor subunit [Mariniphaga sediminis]RIH64675.1 efflux RND transporter periplasmic adaptor subunit [Mariniphaga sediminis]
MKTIGKYVTILATLAIVALLVYKLFSNKKQSDNELKAMSEYSSVIPVEVVSPEIRKSIQSMQENGVVRSDGEITILSETSGRITYVTGEPGERVSAGQTLLRVEREVIESQFELARLTLENAEKDLARYKNLAGGNAVTEQQLENSKLNYRNALTNFTTLKKQLENTEIKSPADGIIIKRFVETGDNLLPSVQVFSLLKKNKMVFVVKVAENDIRHINKGQEATVSLDIIPDKLFTGEVKSMNITPDLSGRYEVEIDLKENDSRFRDGLDGTAGFKIMQAGEGVVIPRKCIEGSINDAVIYLLQGDVVVSRKVEAVSLNETEALITEGLSPDETLVLSGQINLQNGTKVSVLNQ